MVVLLSTRIYGTGRSRRHMGHSILTCIHRRRQARWNTWSHGVIMYSRGESGTRRVHIAHRYRDMVTWSSPDDNASVSVAELGAASPGTRLSHCPLPVRPAPPSAHPGCHLVLRPAYRPSPGPAHG